MRQFAEYKFLRQKPIDNYIVDFYCSELRLVIEIDGDSHAEAVEYDAARTRVLEAFGLTVVRYSNDDVLRNIEGVYDDLWSKIQRLTPTPLTPLDRGGLKASCLEAPSPVKGRVGEGLLLAGEGLALPGTLEHRRNIHTLGNTDLLQQHKVAFFCSRKCPASIVLKAFDWAIEQREKGVCVISGFHSCIEKDVLHYLLKGTQPVILILARGMMKKWAPEIKAALDGNRLLIITRYADSVTHYLLPAQPPDDGTGRRDRDWPRLSGRESGKTVRGSYAQKVVQTIKNSHLGGEL